MSFINYESRMWCISWIQFLVCLISMLIKWDGWKIGKQFLLSKWFHERELCFQKGVDELVNVPLHKDLGLRPESPCSPVLKPGEIIIVITDMISCTACASMHVLEGNQLTAEQWVFGHTDWARGRMNNVSISTHSQWFLWVLHFCSIYGFRDWKENTSDHVD